MHVTSWHTRPGADDRHSGTFFVHVHTGNAVRHASFAAGRRDGVVNCDGTTSANRESSRCHPRGSQVCRTLTPGTPFLVCGTRGVALTLVSQILWSTPPCEMVRTRPSPAYPRYPPRRLLCPRPKSSSFPKAAASAQMLMSPTRTDRLGKESSVTMRLTFHLLTPTDSG